MSAILEFDELVRTFGGLRAVDGATFDVESEGAVERHHRVEVTLRGTQREVETG